MNPTRDGSVRRIVKSSFLEDVLRAGVPADLCPVQAVREEGAAHHVRAVGARIGKKSLISEHLLSRAREQAVPRDLFQRNKEAVL